MSDDEVLVGRAGEFGRYGRELDRLLAGHGGATAFTGDPGIGKTRLLAAFLGAAQSAGVATLTVHTAGEHGQSYGLVDALAEAGRTPGVAMFVDDLHRMPADSASLLAELVRLAGARPVLLVLAYRPRQVAAAVGTVLSRAEASAALRHVALRPLGLAETRALLADHHDAERIHTEGGGNPLYMKLLADLAAESAGGLVGELAGLGGVEQRTAQAAAVLGGPFTMDLLTEVCADGPEATGRAVEGLVAADVLRQDELGPRLAFRHRVVADVVYRHIPIGERWTLHRRVDEVLARRGAAATYRARHVAATGLTGPGHVDVLLTAATASLDADPASALRWAGAAGALMTDGDPRRSDAEGLVARSRLLIGDVTRTRDALLSAPAHVASGAGDRTMSAVYAGRALALLGQYDEASALLRDRLAGVADDPSPDAAALLSDLANLLSDSMDFESATRHAVTAADIARGHGDRLREAAALIEQAWAHGCAGDVESARVAIGAAAALVDAMSDAGLVRDLRCLYQLGLTEVLVDEVIDAHRHLARGVRLCRETGQGYLLSVLLATLGEVQLRLGQTATAVETLDEAVYQAGRDDLVPCQSVAAGVRGIARYWLGDDDATLLADAEAIEARCAGLRFGWAVLSRCMAGELIALAGDPKRGSRLLLTLGGGPELPRLPTRRQVRAWESLTGAALALGDDAAAARYVELAAQHPTVVSSATRRGMARRAAIRSRGRSMEPGELTVAARSAAADFASVHHWLDLAYTEFTAGDAFLDARHPGLAAEHLDRAAEHATAYGGRLTDLVTAARKRFDKSPVPAWARRLTTREVEVAELAGTGLTSAQIGRQLFLSVRTVDRWCWCWPAAARPD
ncbi:MAG TPA: LuxR C-terminal-related transcriptional regulator [Micromonosporaceae bacterium]|nr:LuxR C-terminal-related transcriptional regulator [Micromonosporaceae bacterium]